MARVAKKIPAQSRFRAIKKRFANFQKKYHDSGHILCISLAVIAILCRIVYIILYTVEFSKLNVMHIMSACSLSFQATLLHIGPHSAKKSLHILLTIIIIAALGCEVFLSVDAMRNLLMSKAKANSGDNGNAIVVSKSTDHILLAANVISIFGAGITVLYIACFFIFG